MSFSILLYFYTFSVAGGDEYDLANNKNATFIISFVGCRSHYNDLECAVYVGNIHGFRHPRSAHV